MKPGIDPRSHHRPLFFKRLFHKNSFTKDKFSRLSIHRFFSQGWFRNNRDKIYSKYHKILKFSGIFLSIEENKKNYENKFHTLEQENLYFQKHKSSFENGEIKSFFACSPFEVVPQSPLLPSSHLWKREKLKLHELGSNSFDNALTEDLNYPKKKQEPCQTIKIADKEMAYINALPNEPLKLILGQRKTHSQTIAKDLAKNTVDAYKNIDAPRIPSLNPDYISLKGLKKFANFEGLKNRSNLGSGSFALLTELSKKNNSNENLEICSSKTPLDEKTLKNHSKSSAFYEIDFNRYHKYVKQPVLSESYDEAADFNKFHMKGKHETYFKDSGNILDRHIKNTVENHKNSENMSYADKPKSYNIAGEIWLDAISLQYWIKDYLAMVLLQDERNMNLISPS